MSNLDKFNAVSGFSKSIASNVSGVTFNSLSNGLNSIFAISSTLNTVVDEFKDIGKALKKIKLEDVVTRPDKLIQDSGEIYTTISKLMIPTNLKGTETKISEGTYQRDAGAILFSTGSIFNLRAALSFNNSRQIVNRSQINQTTADLIQEICQEKYSKIEFTNFETSTNRVEIVKEKNIVKSDSFHSYSKTYQNTAKSILIQSYSKKSILANLPVELPIKFPPAIGDILPTGAASFLETGMNALGLGNSSISSAIGGVLDNAGGVMDMVSNASSIVSGVVNFAKNPIPTLAKTALGFAGSAIGNAFKGGVSGLIDNAASSLTGGISDIAKNALLGGGLGGIGSAALGGLFSGGLNSLASPLLGSSNNVAILSQGIVEIFAAKVAQILATKDLTIASQGTIYNVCNRDYIIKSNLAIEAITKRDLKIEAKGFLKLSARKVMISSRPVVSAKARRALVPKQITPFETKILSDVTLSNLEKVDKNKTTVPAAVNQIGNHAVAAGAGGKSNIKADSPDIDNISVTPATNEAHPNTAEVVDNIKENIQPNETIGETYA